MEEGGSCGRWIRFHRKPLRPTRRVVLRSERVDGKLWEYALVGRIGNTCTGAAEAMEIVVRPLYVMTDVCLCVLTCAHRIHAK